MTKKEIEALMEESKRKVQKSNNEVKAISKKVAEIIKKLNMVL